MKLTGTGRGRLRLDLFVFADKRAELPGFETRLCTTVIKREHRFYEEELGEGQKDCYKPVSHPDIVPLMWSGCTLTHLRREADTSDFSEDLYPTWSGPSEYRVILYTQAGAWMRAAYWGIASFSILVFLGTAFLLARKESRQKPWTVLWAASAILGPLLMFCTYVGAEKNEGKPGSRIMLISTGKVLQVTVAQFEPTSNDLTFPEAMRKEILKKVGKDYAYLGMKPEEMEQDVPCGYTIAREGRNWLVTTYLYDGESAKFRFDPSGELIAPNKQNKP